MNKKSILLCFVVLGCSSFSPARRILKKSEHSVSINASWPSYSAVQMYNTMKAISSDVALEVAKNVEVAENSKLVTAAMTSDIAYNYGLTHNYNIGLKFYPILAYYGSTWMFEGHLSTQLLKVNRCELNSYVSLEYKSGSFNPEIGFVGKLHFDLLSVYASIGLDLKKDFDIAIGAILNFGRFSVEAEYLLDTQFEFAREEAFGPMTVFLNVGMTYIISDYPVTNPTLRLSAEPLVEEDEEEW